MPDVRRVDAALFAAFMAILAWAPLPFASNRLWGWLLLIALVSALFSATLVAVARNRTAWSQRIWRHGRWPLFALCGVQLWVLIQCLPLPIGMVEWLSPLAAQWHGDITQAPLSLDPANTWLYLLRGLCYTQAFALTLLLVNSSRRLRILLITLLVSGTFQALYGSFMMLSGIELGFFVEKYIGKGVATGTFVNRNHFAGYLVMCLSAGIALMLMQMEKTTIAQSWRDRLRQGLGFILSPTFLIRACLAFMVIALVLSRSRMGNLAFFVALGTAGVASQVAGRRFSGRTMALFASLLVVDVLILSRWFGLDRLAARLQEMPTEGGRVELLPATLDYVAAFAVTGSGGGSYYGIIPNFLPPDSTRNPVNAHIDYLEFAGELGIPVLILLGVAVLTCAVHAYRAQRDRHHPTMKAMGFCGVMVIAWATVHSLADFNLQIPANAMTFCVVLAACCVARFLPVKTAARKC